MNSPESAVLAYADDAVLIATPEQKIPTLQLWENSPNLEPGQTADWELTPKLLSPRGAFVRVSTRKFNEGALPLMASVLVRGEQHQEFSWAAEASSWQPEVFVNRESHAAENVECFVLVVNNLDQFDDVLSTGKGVRHSGEALVCMWLLDLTKKSLLPLSSSLWLRTCPDGHAKKDSP